MKKEEVKQIISILSKSFKNKEINIIFNGAVEFIITMKNIRFFVSRDIIIIVSDDDRELRIDPYYIDKMEFKNNRIKFEMERLLYSTIR